MIDPKKRIYTNLGYAVTLTCIDADFMEGILESSSSILSWDKEGKCSNGDPDFDLTNKITSFKVAKPRIKKS